MSDVSYVPDWAQDNSVPLTNAATAPSGRLRITVGPNPLPVNGGSPGGSSQAVPDWAQDNSVPISPGNAFVSGMRQGMTANFSDELAGVAAAGGVSNIPQEQGGRDTMGIAPVGIGAGSAMIGLAKLAYEHITGQPGEATAAFNQAVEQARQYQARRNAQQPGASIAGNLTGALMMPAGAEAAPASLGARFVRGATTGGILGSVYGAGEGQGLEDRAARALTGGAIGSIAGGVGSAVLPPVLNAVGNVITSPINTIRAAFDPATAAAKQIAGALGQDVESGGANIVKSLPELKTAAAAGEPVTIMDLGGEATRDVARNAANTSGAARQSIEDVTAPRFKEQSSRVANFVRSFAPFGGNATRTQEALQQAARNVNAPAYRHALAASQGKTLWDNDLENLVQAPETQSAIRLAQVEAKNWAVKDRLPPPENVFDIKNGQTTLRPGKTPGLQLWDYVKRGLDAVGTPTAKAFSRALRTNLDQKVPEYGQARSGAAAFFGAEDALEAGQKFVTSGSLDGAQAAINKMSAPERALFAEGFVSSLADKVMKIPENRSVTLDRIFNSPDGRSRIAMALGRNQAEALQAFLRKEDVLDLTRKAMGNSTTTRQIIQHVLSSGHGAGGVISGMIGGGAVEATQQIMSGELSPKKILMGAIIGGALLGKQVVNVQTATKVAEMLASDDPAVAQNLFRMAANNKQVGGMIRGAETFLERVTGQTSGSLAPTLPGQVGAAANEQQQQP